MSPRRQTPWAVSTGARRGGFRDPPCWMLGGSPPIKVSSDYHQISVIPFTTPVATELLITYLDPTQKIDILHGFLPKPDTWEWTEVTDNFTSAIAQPPDKPEVELTGPCNAYFHPFDNSMYCIVKGIAGSHLSYEGSMAVFDLSVSSSSRFEVGSGRPRISP